MSTVTAPSPAKRRDPRLEGVRLVAILLAIMWVGEIVDQVILDQRLDQYGIEPRDTDGLVGIVASPFLHGDFGHLIANTIPFAAMGAMIALGGLARVAMVTVIVGLVAGIGTWIIAPENTIHIGASGLVFGYGSYLLARAFFERKLVHIVTAAVVVVFYGGALLGGMVPEEGISWQGHLFGFIGGIVAARMLAPDAPTPPARRSKDALAAH